MEDKRYPIYSLAMRWTCKPTTHDNKPRPLNEYDKTHGLAEGRIWNGSSQYTMFKEDQTPQQLDVKLLEYWAYIKSSKSSSEPELFSLSVELKLRESWCMTWFSHYTFDVGQSDEEARASFWSYVLRMLSGPRRDNGDLEYCLMGAEDTWRWKSGSDTYEGIPCRCRYCKEQGVLRIAH